MTITLPVSALSRKIILSEYGCVEPLRIARTDTLYIPLTARGLNARHTPASAAQLLTASITLEVNDTLCRHISMHRISIGYALYRWHKERMIGYTLACVRAGGDAWRSIQDFLFAYDIGEDEFPLDTAYKNWQRYWWNLEKKKASFRSQKRDQTGVKSVSVPCPHPCRRRGESLPPADVVEVAVSTAIERLKGLYRNPGKRMPLQLRYYIYMVCGYSSRAAAPLVGASRAAVLRGYHAVAAKSRRSRAFRRTISEVLQEHALPAAA